MKHSIKFLYILVISFLPSILFAQTRHIDLQAVMTQPTNGETVITNQPFQYVLYVKNNGPDTLKTTDTVAYAFSGGGGAALFSGQLINPHDSVQILSASPTIPQAETIPICFAIAIYDTANTVDPDTLNNIICDTVTAVDPTGVAEVKTGSAIFSIYPNPATSSSVTLTFMSEVTDDMSVSVTDISGKEVFSKDFGKIPTGKNELKLELPGLRSGMYFIEARQGNIRSAGKLIVQ